MTPHRSGFRRLLHTEMTLQYRNGLYLVYLVLTAFFLAIIALVPAPWRETAIGLVILLDPTFIGFFFAGGLVLLEREQGILTLVATTRGGFRDYARPKVVALIILAGTVAAVLLGAGMLAGFARPTPGGVVRLTIGLALSIPVFFHLGVILAAWKPRVIEYFVFASVALVPLMIPLAEPLGVATGIVGKLSPVWGAMTLITSVFTDRGDAASVAGAVGSLLVWNVLIARWASRAFRFLAENRDRNVGGRTRASGGAVPRRTRTTLSGTMVDVRLMVRDPVIVAMFFAPILAAVMLGRVIPYAVATYGGMSVFAPLAGEYLDNLRSFALLPGVVVYGVVGAFLILDEKDGGVIPFLRTVPGKPGWYILRRGAMLLVIHLVMVAPAVVAGNLFHATPFRFVMSVLVDATLLPVVYLAVAVIAENKVQGLAVAKVINLLTLPPLLLMAIPDRWAWAVGVFPSAWGTLIRLYATSPGSVLASAAAGMVYSGTVTVLLYRRVAGVGRGLPGTAVRLHRYGKLSN